MKKTLITPRVNDMSTQWFRNDIDSLVKHQQNGQLIAGLMIPKIQYQSEIRQIESILRGYEQEMKLINQIKICPVIQTAKGMMNIRSILEAAQQRTLYVAFGADDLLRSMQIVRTPEEQELEFYRQIFIMHCKAFGLQGLDTPYPNYKSEEGLREKINYLKRLGFKGMQAIHPAQVDIINQHFAPSEKEIENAKRQVQAFQANLKEKGRGAVGVDGVMVDVPVYRRAKELLESAQNP